MARCSTFLAFAALALCSACAHAQLGGPVMDWLDMLADRVRDAKPVNHQVASKWYAQLSIAMHNSLKLRDASKDPRVRAVPDAVMICYAAHAYLTAEFPASSTDNDKLIAKHLVDSPKEVRDAARNLGRQAAYSLIKKCVTDGFAVWSEFELPAPKTGVYRLQPNQTCQHPQWGYTRPLSISQDDVDSITTRYVARGKQFIGTQAYYNDVEYVRTHGGRISSVRTLRDNLTPYFWADMVGTYATAGHWISIAASVLSPDMDIAEQAHFFAAFTSAMSDASIPCFKTKYKALIWRPISAINNGDKSGKIQQDANWTTYLPMPNHPSFPSGHSCIAGAASKFLEIYTGSDETFVKTTSEGKDANGMPITETRFYKRFSTIAKDTGNSRVLGGLHYPFDCMQGAKLGGEVATLVAKRFRI